MSENENVSIGVDTILSQPNYHNRGRPSKPEELEIERTLQGFFFKNCTASFASRKTGYNIKTVAKYYNKFKTDILESENLDFIKKCKEENEMYRNTLGEMIYSLYSDLEEVESLIDAAKKIGDIHTVTKLYRIKLKIYEDIGSFVSAKTNLTNTATFADTADILQAGDKNDT